MEKSSKVGVKKKFKGDGSLAETSISFKNPNTANEGDPRQDGNIRGFRGSQHQVIVQNIGVKSNLKGDRQGEAFESMDSAGDPYQLGHIQ